MSGQSPKRLNKPFRRLLVPWAKITMAVQSVISLAILGLVIARAVNVLT